MSALHHHLMVTPDSSGHLNMVDSPTSDTSPSLKAPSTDQDYDRYRSSPSTSFTSACDSDGDYEGLAPASAGSMGQINTDNMSFKPVAGQAMPIPSRTWKMPFAKSSAPPRAFSSVGCSAAGAAGGLSSKNSPPRRSKASSSSKTYSQDAQENDGSFVETTSEKAAQALAQYWNDVQVQADVHGKRMSKVATPASDYVVVARVENGKRIYKIRPRSRPSIALAESQKQGHVLQSSKQQPSATLQMPPSIRLTKSIPNLRTRTSEDSALSPISRDKDGFYRPAGSSTHPDNAYLALPFNSGHHLLHVNNTTQRARKQTLQTASSIPNLRSHRDQDVFGKLLGWGLDDHSTQATTLYTPSFRGQAGQTISVSPPRTQSPEQHSEKGSPVKQTYEDAVHTPNSASFPYQLAPSLQEASRASIDSMGDLPTPSTSSPFGQGVRLPSQPRLKRKKSIRQLHGTIMAPQALQESGNNTFDSLDGFDTSLKIRSLREVGSSETIRTATGPAAPLLQNPPSEDHPDGPRTPMATESQRDAWLSDTRIFDNLEYVSADSPAHTVELKDSLRPTSEGPGRRHERGMSNTSLVSLGGTSLHSINSATSAGEQAHTIAVTSIPGDDRRFVIWGRKPGPPVRPSANARLSPASLSGSGAQSFSSSKRSSFQNQHDSTDQSTPPTSAGSPSSPWSSSTQSQKVLLAATVDRWIADMTSRIENDLMTDFFLTYRSFLSPMALCKLLITRFEWALQPGSTAEDIAGRRIVRVRTYVVFKHWLLNYFNEDFVPDRELRLLLTTWLNRMGKDERLRPNPTDLRLIKSLKKVTKRLKAMFTTIGAEQATDATTLIKTSLEEEADSRNRTRARSDSKASMSSLQSIREEQSEPLVFDSHPNQADTGPESSLAAPDPCNVEGHIRRKDIRTSSSEDDVDLDIELHVSGYDSDEMPRIPSIIPISPPRARHHSPVHQRKSRSPQLGSYERTSRTLDGIPVIQDNHRVSRAIASTVGSFSKLRRMMGTRRAQASSNALSYPSDSTSDMAQLGLVRRDQEEPHRALSTLSRSLSGHPNGQSAPGLGISHAHSTSPPSAGVCSTATPSVPDLRHVASNGTMRRQSSRQNIVSKGISFGAGRASFIEDDSHSPPEARLAPAANIRMSGVQLDDCDSSGDESNSGERAPLRTLRRLPAARDLRGGKSSNVNPLAHRHSIDSIASYATRRLPSCALEPIQIPSIATYDSNSSAHDADRDALVDQGMVPFFVPPNDSEDEDEPGDVEAALRRLEGQVDHEKQRSNAQKVERYLKISEEAKANGGYIYGDMDEQSDEENPSSSRPVSSAMSLALGSATGVATQSGSVEVAAEELPQDLDATVLPPTVPQSLQSEFSLTVPDSVEGTVAGKRTLQRKSSMRRFFGSTVSVSLWPASSTHIKNPKSRVVQAPAYRSFIFSHKIEALARHFCIIERDLLEKVTWQELIGATWRERLEIGEVMDWDSFMKIRAKLNSDGQGHQLFPSSALAQPKRVGDVQTIIHRFNLMCRWIASEIVLTTSTAERALLLTKIIRLAFKSYQMYNFQTATQIVHALQLPSIERLRKTWSKVPNFETKLFDRLKFFCSPLRDFRLLREATAALAMQWGPPGQEDRDPDKALQGVPGALPFFGLILRDLAISNELPTFLDPSNPRAPAVIDEDTMLLPEYADASEFADLPPLPQGIPLRPLINIHKYRIIAKTVRHVMTFQELAGTYPYEPELPIYRKCLTIQCLPMAKIVELSTACER